LDYLAVAIGGFLGAVIRFILSQLIKTEFIPAFPLGTLVINLSGCFVLSFFMNLTMERLSVKPCIRLAFGTGFLGAYTTFSAFTVETLVLWETGLFLQSAIYFLATSIGCLLLAWAGNELGGKLKRWNIL
jgi:CrcB protein